LAKSGKNFSLSDSETWGVTLAAEFFERSGVRVYLTRQCARLMIVHP
jgi:hypothetical protein